jgi:hypothetical protein
MEINWILISFITVALGALATFLFVWKRGPEDTTEQRIQHLSSSLLEAMKLIGEMEREVNSKHSLLEKL